MQVKWGDAGAGHGEMHFDYNHGPSYKHEKVYHKPDKGYINVKRTNIKRKPVLTPQATYFAPSFLPGVKQPTQKPEQTYFYSNKLGAFVLIR